MDLEKILNSADKARKPKKQKRKQAVILPHGNMTMTEMIAWKNAQADEFEDAAECGDKD